MLHRIYTDEFTDFQGAIRKLMYKHNLAKTAFYD